MVLSDKENDDTRHSCVSFIPKCQLTRCQSRCQSAKVMHVRAFSIPIEARLEICKYSEGTRVRVVCQPILESIMEPTLSRSRKTYRKYLWDPTAPIPRTTLLHHRKRAVDKVDNTDLESKKDSYSFTCIYNYIYRLYIYMYIIYI